MNTTTTGLREFFHWTDSGLGRVSFPCPSCLGDFGLHLLDNVLEAVCAHCGKNAVFSASSRIEREHGALHLAKVLKEVGLLTDDEHRRALRHWRRDEQALTEALIASGAFSKSLLLVNEDGVFTARSLKELIQPEQVAAALRERNERGGKIGEILTALVLEDQKEEILSRLAPDDPRRCPSAHLAPEPEALSRVPFSVAEAHRLVPLSFDEDRNCLRIATADPMNYALQQRLGRELGICIDAVLADEDALFMALEEHYAGESLPDLDENASGEIDSIEATVDPGALWSDGPPEVRTLSMILLHAAEDRARRVFLEPSSEGFSVRFSGGRRRREALSLSRDLGRSLVTRLKVLSGMDVSANESQVGYFFDQVASERIRVKILTLPTVLGESALIEFLKETVEGRGLSELGFFEDDGAALLRCLDSRLVVTCANRLGGASTTHYAFMRELLNKGLEVLSLERSVRLLLPGVTQVERSQLAKLGPSIGQLEPDAFFLDPLEDREGLDLALKTSLAGGRAFISVKAPSALEGMARLWHLGVPPGLLRQLPVSVIVQYRVGKICSGCRVDFEPEASELEELGIHPAELFGTIPQEGIGCWACDNEGVLGQRALFSVTHLNELQSSGTPDRFFAEIRSASGIRQSALRALREGMVSLDLSREIFLSAR